MKKYTDPEMTVTSFTRENILTGSGDYLPELEAWKKEQSGEVRLTKIQNLRETVEFTF